MRRGLLVLAVVVPAVVGALLLIAACGGSETAAVKPFPSVDVAQAAARTAGAESARLTLSGEAGSGGSFSGEGELAGNRGQGELHFSEAVGGLIPADVEAVYADGQLYVRLSGPAGLLSGLATGGKQWLGVDLGADGDVLAEYFDFGEADPAELLELLEDAGEFEEAGREQVRGVETTRFQGSVASTRVEVWVGADELVRRVTVRDDDGDHIELELYDFGADVDIEPPPSDEVVELAELLGGGG